MDGVEGVEGRGGVESAGVYWQVFIKIQKYRNKMWK